MNYLVPKLIPKSLFLILLGCMSSPVWAHYLWLKAIPDSVDGDSIVNVDIRVGDDWPGEPVANELSKFEIFDVYRAGNSDYVSGERGRIPAGFIEEAANPFAVYYRSVRRSLVMDQSDFLRHLVAEGLTDAFNLYEKTARPSEIEESYTHHAVLLVDQVVLPENPEVRQGLMLQPDFTNSTTINPPTRFQLTYRGQPVANAPVTLSCEDQSLPPDRLYSSAEGWVTFDQLCPGNTVLRSIFMRALDQGATQWESHWLSLTLHRR